MNELDNLQHVGVKGMKWGVRKKRRPPERTIDLVTKNGEKIKAEVDSLNPIAKKLGQLFPNLAEKQARYTSVTLRNSQGKKVGFGTMNHDPDNSMHLVIMEVPRKHRGKGYASALFAQAEKEAIAVGATKLKLEVPQTAKDARHIYDKAGFKKTGTIGDKNEAFGIMDVMVKDIDLKQSYDSQYDIFDRFSVWQVSSIEFKEVETLADEFKAGHNPKVEEMLQHAGVKGMRWGVRKDRDGSSKGKKPETSVKGGSKDESNKAKEPGFFKSRANSAKREQDWEKVIDKFDKMGDKEIIAVSKRINLENDFKRLAYKKARVGTNPFKTKIGTKEDKRAYLNREKMSDQELSRVVTRLRAKEAIVTGANKATAAQRERGMKIANVAAPLIFKAAMGRKLNVADVIDAASNYNNKSALNTVASKAGQELVGATMAKAAARAAR